MERILIVRLGSMGDVIHALPAVTALRNAFPQLSIGWVIETQWSDLLRARGSSITQHQAGQPLVDRVHEVDTKAWRRGWRSLMGASATWAQLRAAVDDLRGCRYQVAVDMQGSIKSAVVAQLSGAPRRIGAAHPWESPAAMLYTHAAPQKGVHVIERGMELASAAAGQILSFPAQPIEFPRDVESESWCEFELQQLGIAGFALLAPGAGWASKRWPAARYGEVAAALAVHGLRSLITTGPGEESLADAVQQASNGAAHPVHCSLGQLIALTRRARLFIGGDTGPLHLADALRIPVVAIFGPTDPARNGPVGARAIVLRPADIRTTYAHDFKADPALLAIPASAVIAAVRRILAQPSPTDDEPD